MVQLTQVSKAGLIGLVSEISRVDNGTDFAIMLGSRIESRSPERATRPAAAGNDQKLPRPRFVGIKVILIVMLFDKWIVGSSRVVTRETEF